MSARSLTRAATGMGAASAASRAVGFVRVLVVAAVLGTTHLGDAFNAANSVSNVVFELVAAGALSAVLVPTFVALSDRGDDDEADRLAGAVLGFALVVLGVLVAVAVVLAPVIARLLTSGVDERAAADQRALVTFLLRFFVPQVLLYACGAVATALLYARRRFAVTALAPIGNTLVVVGALALFREVAGSDPGLDLSLGPRLVLAVAGTGGVVAFVGVLVVAARRAGFRLRPRLVRRDPAVAALLRRSAWGTLLHASAGLLLGAAIVLGSGVEGGVVAYQTAFVFFLAPYGILAQPVHTAVLPEVSSHASAGDLAAAAGDVRWALSRMAVVVMPVAALAVALALPLMRAVAFGEATGRGVTLLAAGLASLAVGLFPYGAFMLFARGYYALDDSRRPALVAVACGALGVVVMAVASASTHGAARVAALGAGHSVTYLAGAVVLGVGLRSRLGRPLWSADVARAAAAAAAAGVAAWSVALTVDADRRAVAVVAVAIGTAVAGGLYTAGARVLRLPLPTVLRP
jgi:putative peptidoglycan lipid II flippase